MAPVSSVWFSRAALAQPVCTMAAAKALFDPAQAVTVFAEPEGGAPAQAAAEPSLTPEATK